MEESTLHPSPLPDPPPRGGRELKHSADAKLAVDWQAVRRAYELSGDTVASIRARFGLSVHDLRQRRVAERWTARPQVARTGPLPMPLRRLAVGCEAIEFRLNRLLSLGIALLEKRLAEEGLTDANARTLTELCRAEESRMRTIRQKTGKTRETKNHDAGYDFRDDPAWLDAEIRRRIERLTRAQEAQGASDEVEGGEAGGARGLAR